MKKLSLVVASMSIVLTLAPTFAYAWPWSNDMANQISIKPQESVDPSNPGMNPFPKRSVPVPGTTVMVNVDNVEKLPNPVPASARSVDTGRRLFEIYCVPCHGKSGTGDGLVGAKLIMPPANLTATNDIHSWDPKKDPQYTDGYIFGHLTFGGPVMPPYAIDLSPTERWNVVNYLRVVLQKLPAATTVAQTK